MTAAPWLLRMACKVLPAQARQRRCWDSLLGQPGSATSAHGHCGHNGLFVPGQSHACHGCEPSWSGRPRTCHCQAYAGCAGVAAADESFAPKAASKKCKPALLSIFPRRRRWCCPFRACFNRSKDSDFQAAISRVRTVRTYRFRWPLVQHT